MSSRAAKGHFSLDDVHKIGGVGGIGSRNVVFISDEYAEVSRHPDGVVLQQKTASSLPSWVRDADIERARNFAAGLTTSQGSLAVGLQRSATVGANNADASEQPTRKGIAASLAALRQKKAEAAPKAVVNSGAAVYGFWQTALHNGVVDLKAPLTVAPFTDRSGLFLLTHEGRIVSSGIFRAGLIPGTEHSLDQAVVLDVSESTLRGWKVPSEPCMTSAEKLRARQRQRDTRAIRIMVSAVGSAAIALGLYLYLSSLAVERANALSAASARSAEIDSQNAEIRRLRFTSERYPDGESIIALAAVQQLYYATQSLRLEWPNILGPEFVAFEVSASPPVHELTFRHTQRVNPDGTVVYRWNKGEGALGASQ